MDVAHNPPCPPARRLSALLAAGAAQSQRSSLAVQYEGVESRAQKMRYSPLPYLSVVQRFDRHSSFLMFGKFNYATSLRNRQVFAWLASISAPDDLFFSQLSDTKAAKTLPWTCHLQILRHLQKRLHTASGNQHLFSWLLECRSLAGGKQKQLTSATFVEEVFQILPADLPTQVAHIYSPC